MDVIIACISRAGLSYMKIFVCNKINLFNIEAVIEILETTELGTKLADGSKVKILYFLTSLLQHIIYNLFNPLCYQGKENTKGYSVKMTNVSRQAGDLLDILVTENRQYENSTGAMEQLWMLQFLCMYTSHTSTQRTTFLNILG